MSRTARSGAWGLLKLLFVGMLVIGMFIWAGAHPTEWQGAISHFAGSLVQFAPKALDLILQILTSLLNWAASQIPNVPAPTPTR